MKSSFSLRCKSSSSKTPTQHVSKTHYTKWASNIFKAVDTLLPTDGHPTVAYRRKVVLMVDFDVPEHTTHLDILCITRTSQNMPTETDIRNIKCGFVSLYKSLVCRKSVLLDTFNIHSITDLYNLIMFGNENRSSMFDALKTEYWIAEYIRLPEHKWQLYLDFSKKRIIETGSVIQGFQLLVAVYLNIHIVLQPNPQKYTDMKELEQANEEARRIEKGMQRITDPIETIEISLEPKHVEYIARPGEERCCETIHKELLHQHLIADELQATEEMFIMMNDDNDLFDGDVDFWDEEFETLNNLLNEPHTTSQPTQ